MPGLRRCLLASLAAVACVVGACGGAPTTPTSPTSPGSPVSPGPAASGFMLQGDPESAQGAMWTFTGIAAGANVDIQGVLMKPRGTGPFPAVIISHGAGGNANAYSRGIASDMVGWGLVCIATNYTHAANVPPGSPGTSNDPGASSANVTRARAVYEILRVLGYIDMSRVAAHGHSMGAFLTAGLMATYPAEFRVASHTAGGVRPDFATGAAPTESQARSIRTPYQMHHGDQDTTVPLIMDQRLADVLQSVGTTRELVVYPGSGHNEVARDAVVLRRVRDWYAAHGMF